MTALSQCLHSQPSELVAELNCIFFCYQYVKRFHLDNIEDERNLLSLESTAGSSRTLIARRL